MRLLTEFQTQKHIYMLMGASTKLAETLAMIIIKRSAK